MKLRLILCAIAAMFAAACDPPAQKAKAAPEPAPAPAKTQAPPPPRLDHETIIGTWSFDGSCASGDGMGLRPDNTAFYDEWGTGTWSINRQNQIVLDLVRREMGVEEDPGEPVTLTIDVRASSDEALEVVVNGAGEEPRETTAMRCS
ncbi:MAG TPA: hypothetical protein VEF55_10230 [Candidatus Binatia bacterium]|nr:hypothetical protein [Candidatus Binatia bacterium]